MGKQKEGSAPHHSGPATQDKVGVTCYQGSLEEALLETHAVVLPD